MNHLIDVGMQCFVALDQIAFVHEGNPKEPPFTIPFFAGHIKAVIYLRDGDTAPCYVSVATLLTRIRDAGTLTQPDTARAEYQRGRRNGYASGYAAGQRRGQAETPAT